MKTGFISTSGLSGVRGLRYFKKKISNQLMKISYVTVNSVDYCYATTVGILSANSSRWIQGQRVDSLLVHWL